MKVGSYVLVNPKFGLLVKNGEVTKITPCDNELLVTVKAFSNGCSYVVPDKFLELRSEF